MSKRRKMGDEKRVEAFSLISKFSKGAEGFLRSAGEEKGTDEFSLISKISNLAENFLRSEEHRQEFLPGIHDEITLKHIITKLPFSAFSALSLVSRSWEQAIRMRNVHNARVRFNSTETLLLVCSEPIMRGTAVDEPYCRSSGVEWKLLSVRDKSFYPLPPLPSVRGFPQDYNKCIGLDGKIYVIGGHDLENKTTPKLFCLDLVGQRQWKKCASMLEGREKFGCGVFDGKIYVFGGECDNRPVYGSEAYDPETNVWSSITPMSTLRRNFGVAIVGEELLVHGGLIEIQPFPEAAISWWVRYHKPESRAGFLEFYNPVTNSWRAGARDGVSDEWKGTTFTANGKLFSADHDGLHISVYNFDTDSWTASQSSAVPSNVSFDSSDNIFGLHVDGELVSVAFLRDELDMLDFDASLYYFLKSSGFGTERELVWERVLGDNATPEVLCLIQL